MNKSIDEDGIHIDACIRCTYKRMHLEGGVEHGGDVLGGAELDMGHHLRQLFLFVVVGFWGMIDKYVDVYVYICVCAPRIGVSICTYVYIYT